MTGEEKPDADAYKKIRTRFIRKNVFVWSAVMTALNVFRSHPVNVKEFLIYLGVSLVLFPISGLLAATLLWGTYGKRICETTIAKERGISKRVPIAVDYHPRGVIVMSAVGALIIAADLLFTKTTWTDYVTPALVVCPLMLLQLVLDMRYADEEYVMRTTFPSPGFSFNQAMRIKWPCMLLLLALPLGPVKVAGLFSVCLIFSYPYQRHYYLKSRKEFGDSLRDDGSM